MTDKHGRTKAYDITCRDNSHGRVTAESANEAKEGGQDMCDIHGGVKGATERKPGQADE